jgi:hypothetical protein
MFKFLWESTVLHICKKKLVHTARTMVSLLSTVHIVRLNLNQRLNKD